MIKAEVPELYVLGNPPASVVAFASKHPKVKAHEVGDRMSKKGWHLNAMVNPDACHIAVTVSVCFRLIGERNDEMTDLYVYSALLSHL
jgi:hypothetical protein